MMALSRKKTSLIHVAKRNLGLSEEVYRDILLKVAGVASSSDLDEAGFAAVMEYMTAMGFKSTGRTGEFGPRRNMATPAQVRYIRALWGDFTDGQGTDAGFSKWLDGKFHVSALRFVSAELAPKVITALRAMVANKARK